MKEKPYTAKEFRRNRWHVIDPDGHPLYDDAPYGNDKPLVFWDEDDATECAKRFNEQTEETKNSWQVSLSRLYSAMNKEFFAEYEQKFQSFQSGEISKEEWQDFCMQALSVLIEANKDVFVRLKER